MQTYSEDHLSGQSRSAVHDLLIRCLHRYAGCGDETRLRVCAPEEWDELVFVADQYGLASLLYLSLSSGHRLELLPPNARETLQRLYQCNVLRNQMIFHHIGSTAQSCQARQIPLIFLKGVHMSAAYYAVPAARSMSDVDVLTTYEHLPELLQILSDQGYQPIVPFQFEKELETRHHVPPYLHPRTGLKVEVHWSITQPNRPHHIDPDELWERALPFPVPGGGKALGLSPEDLLLHLCAHAVYNHRLEFGLRSIYDIREVLASRGERLDWGLVIERSERWGWAPGIYLALRLAQEVAGAEIPEEALAEFPVPSEQAPIQAAMEMVFSVRQEDKLLLNRLRITQQVQSRSIREKVRHFRDRLFISRYDLAKRYRLAPSSPLLALYYFVRVKDLIRRYGPTIFHDPEEKSHFQQMADRSGELESWLRNTN